MKMNWFDWLTLILVIVGGLNWGLVGFFGYNLVDSIFMAWPLGGTIVYDVVGLSALYTIYSATKMGK